MDLEQKAIERIKIASDMSIQIYKKSLVVTDSGGKDSLVCRELVRRAGVPYEVQHNFTTADAPRFIMCGKLFESWRREEFIVRSTCQFIKASRSACGR